MALPRATVLTKTCTTEGESLPHPPVFAVVHNTARYSLCTTRNGMLVHLFLRQLMTLEP